MYILYLFQERAYRYTHNDLGEVLDHPRHRVEDITLLHKADLIAFPRKVLSDTDWMGYWHLAIVESVDTRNKNLIVIHYQPVFDESYKSNSRQPTKFEKGVVTRTELDFLNEKIWTVELDPNYCLPADIVIELARSRIGEKDYDILINNCESFAFWCKTGSNYSSQARTAKKIALQQGSRAIAKVAVRKVAERSLTTSLLRSNAAAFGVRAARVPRFGGLFVAADVAVTAGFAARDIMKAKRKFEEGKINQDEYERAVNTRMTVTAGDMTCSVLGTLLGTALGGPVGAVIGGTIGSGIGTVLGSATATAVVNGD